MFKATCTSISVALLFSSSLGLAQVSGEPVQPVDEPEFVGVFYHLNTVDGSLEQLERQKSELQFKSKLLGLKRTVSYAIANGSSPVRFREGESLEFVVRLGSQQMDPLSTIRLMPLIPSEASREEKKRGLTGVRLEVRKFNTDRWGDVRIEPSTGALAISAEKYGNYSTKFRPVAPLPKGEYVLSTPLSPVRFCFGVGANDSDSRVQDRQLRN